MVNITSAEHARAVFAASYPRVVLSHIILASVTVSIDAGPEPLWQGFGEDVDTGFNVFLLTDGVTVDRYAHTNSAELASKAS